MALIRPTLPAMTIMDAGHDKEIEFEVFGGDQYVGFDIEIYNNSTNVLHFSASKDTYSNKFNIEANVLANGTDYRFRCRTRTANTYSEFSDFMLLKCYTTPVCSINNLEVIDDVRVVNNQNYTMQGSFFQAENVSLKSYRYILYDYNKNVLQEFNTVYTTITAVNQRVEGLSPQTDYYIELRCIDQYDLEVTTGLVHFFCDYVAPRIKQRVDLENEKETASVKISSTMIQIIFQTDKNPPVYINEQEIDLTDNRAYINRQFDLVGNFTLKIYLRAIPRIPIGKRDYFLTMTSIDGNTKIKFKESGGRIHVYKVTTPDYGYMDVIGHYASDVMEGYVPGESSILVQINHVNRRIDVFAHVFTENPVVEPETEETGEA